MEEGYWTRRILEENRELVRGIGEGGLKPTEPWESKELKV